MMRHAGRGDNLETCKYALHNIPYFPNTIAAQNQVQTFFTGQLKHALKQVTHLHLEAAGSSVQKSLLGVREPGEGHPSHLRLQMTGDYRHSHQDLVHIVVVLSAAADEQNE